MHLVLGLCLCEKVRFSLGGLFAVHPTEKEPHAVAERFLDRVRREKDGLKQLEGVMLPAVA